MVRLSQWVFGLSTVAGFTSYFSVAAAPSVAVTTKHPICLALCMGEDGFLTVLEQLDGDAKCPDMQAADKASLTEYTEYLRTHRWNYVGPLLFPPLFDLESKPGLVHCPPLSEGQPFCPSGYAGQWPNCYRFPPPSSRELDHREGPRPVCPPGTVGRYPNCFAPIPPLISLVKGRGSCPSDAEENHPDCSAVISPQLTTPKRSLPECPPGTVGQYPNCRNFECPAGTVGRYPDCRQPECPPGTTGKYPNCQKPFCPAGTVGNYPNCSVPEGGGGQQSCPSGTVGQYPNCSAPIPPPSTTPVKGQPVCPPGTVGRYPDCRQPQCPPGTLGQYPNCYKPILPPVA